MPEHSPRPGYRFPGPVPKEALDYFRFRAPKVGFDYRDVWLQEHAHAFTVAKAMEVEILMDIRAALDKAIADGTTLEQFRKDLTPLLQRKGWWGKKEMTDPRTGKRVVAQLGSPRRLRTIYRANIRAARAAGIWQRAQRTKKTHPYLLYELGPSKEHRDQHRAWAGTLLPVDDPWWNDHFPPNGWGCKCRVRQVSRREAERLGGPTSRPARQPEERVNRRTGEVQIVDKGIDPAWASNPGRDRGRVLMENLNEKISRADYDIARSSVRSVMNSPIFDGFRHQPSGDLLFGVLGRKAQRDIGSDTPLARMSAGVMSKQERAHPNFPDDYYRLLPDIVGEPDHVLRLMPRVPISGEKIRRRVHLIRTINGKTFDAIVERSAKAPAKVELVSLHRVSGGEKRIAELVRRDGETRRKLSEE